MSISSYILWTTLIACSSEKIAPTAQINTEFTDSVFILDIAETEEDWLDFAYLSAIPTSTILTWAILLFSALMMNHIQLALIYYIVSIQRRQSLSMMIPLY